MVIFSIIGLSLNFVGTLLVAFSIRTGEVIAMQEKSAHPKWESMIQYNPCIFYLGIASLALGFFLQILGQIRCLN
jgi:hypothetical protein